MTLNFQAMNILNCALDVNKYNRVSGCDSALEITDHLVADCPKAIEKEKGALEAKLEALKKKKKGKGLIGTWDHDSSESEGEEKKMRYNLHPLTLLVSLMIIVMLILV
ncbi:hypothetical protein M9H77_02600 [Catharanthus roseus]|uniref:Uncharacterized protein n=1 Tax=Catharanthus roseus TaxID=4058 RepID=A0ACC0C9C8_CATRO|nr:hypothetical protein M9H77_02600 [Catharanthus roseus]